MLNFFPPLRDPLTRGFLKEKGNDLRSAHGDRGVRFWVYYGGPMHRSSPTLAWALFWDGGRIDKGGYQFLIVE
jgi:hypothetical protein